ncbi:TPA: phosphotransferase [Legionella pneumophila]|nr:phosphotransferase [Legionella pneumophila subsp. pneumophila]HAU3487180.1 phosphotransferase [Legionella pneumophila]HAT8869623.1 phosphotransferase [Legionella pneumophila subsp. pneumophila]HAU3496743.1 phosphotransferase [Legionella pneumophila]HCU6104825.1 phosphotransferase [Legionella pneumophila]
MFFSYQLPLSVVNNITRFLDKDSKAQLSKVNRAWHNFPFEAQNLTVNCDDEVPVDKLMPHLLKVLSKKTDSVSIERLTAGCSPWAASYKVNTGKECFVVRQINHCSGRSHEILISLFFSEAGVAPKIEYFDFASGIFIMRFVDNDPNLLRNLSTNQLEDLAAKLRKIHKGPKLKRPTEVESSTLISLRRNQLEDMIQKYSEFYLLAYALEQLDYFATLTREDALCHNDINPNNLLAQQDNIFFIDWECAGVNDALLDLATIVSTLRLSASQSDILLEKYIGKKPSEEQMKHFNLMKQIALLRFAISFAANIKNPEQVRMMEIKSIPAFNQYRPEQHGVVDRGSDAGRYFISIMLIKQAMLTINDYHFKQVILLEKAPRAQLHYLPLPHIVWNKIFNLLSPIELAKLKLVSRDWAAMVRSLQSLEQTFTQKSVMALAKSEDIGRRLWNALICFMPNPRGTLGLLSGGLSPFCQNFFLDTGLHKFVIKVVANGDVSFIPECVVNSLASKQGVAPLVERVDFANGVQISEFVENDMSWLIQRKPSHLAELAAALRTFHSAPQPRITSFFKKDKFDEMVDTVLRQSVSMPFLAEFKWAISLIRQIDPVLRKDIKQVICHFDINPWNILYSAKRYQFKLIDWEFTRVGQPLIDVATIANFLRLNPIEEAFFLMAYINQGVSLRDEATYQLAKLYAYLRYAICSLAINGDTSYTTDPSIVESLPRFSESNPKLLKIDKNTAEGRYYIAKMFLKSADTLLKEVNFVEQLRIFRDTGTQEILDIPQVPLLEDLSSNGQNNSPF